MSLMNNRLSQKNQYQKNQFSSNTLRLHENGKIFTLNYRWIFSSAISILIGLFTMYTSMHYLTAFFSPQQFLWSSDNNSAANQLENSSVGMVDSMFDSFTRDQAYFRAGKKLAAHYVIPEGKSVELTIVRCQSVIIVEVFRCTPGESQRLLLGDRLTGVETYKLSKGGFYVYHSRLLNTDGTEARNKDGYRVVWRRA